jgi:hypothetical protein
VRVSILIHSPSFTNRGTFTVAPVAIVAGLVTLLAVSPFTPGSLAVICTTTCAGSSTPIALPFQSMTSTARPSMRNWASSPIRSLLT